MKNYLKPLQTGFLDIEVVMDMKMKDVSYLFLTLVE